MIRILLVFVVPFFLPTAVYILWRTFAPIAWGGSEVIAKDEWEPLPWKILMIIGGAMVAIALLLVIMFPDVFGGGELDEPVRPTQ